MSAARVVVTGGGGFIGSHLVDELVVRGDEVTVFDGVAPGDLETRPGTSARHVVGDIRDDTALSGAIVPGVDVVYHMAAVVGVDQYLSRPLDVIDINFGGTRAVVERACQVGARVVLASTSEVFGKNPAVPWKEDGDRLLGPTTTDRWTYATSKALAEHLTFAFARQHGLAATVVRYFNVYGPRQRPAYVVSRSVHRALNGLPPVVYDQGRQTRCLTYVADAVEATLSAGTVPEAVGQVFNIGSMRESTVADVVELVGRLTGGGTPAVTVDTGSRLGTAYEDLPRRIPDNTRARTMLNWDCGTALETGIARTVAWARANPWWLAGGDTGAE
ncbi:NAD-dependent epimerase/dehydratase family protein [Solwaraspora sp. WMMA2056]|uniref:NAD-dependent epimerase/dehydratase family protein n=1 Tax=Solwaraspora sp. WMMA2056 TaxID=3015161 RepID=UPI00259BF402|nr:NAD-dependent epimerase/dehydratase family protein [Solwaraspora sp. WMMA2056]WJK42596.1 NAD-dependent epimerase/dehydratase family protein [Solwaraspora sp. WMMA2056]